MTGIPTATALVVPFAFLRYARRMNKESKVGTEVRGAALCREQRRRCLDHAGNLIAAAERVLADDNAYPNIAYHLAILAMEEIGKAGMLASRAVIGAALDGERIIARVGGGKVTMVELDDAAGLRAREGSLQQRALALQQGLGRAH